MAKIKVVSTFAGIGGSSEGYKRAGLKPSAAIEMIEHVAKQYRVNFPTTPVILSDIREVTGDMIEDTIGGKVDILDGSPPCECFTTARNGSPSSWNRTVEYKGKRQRIDNLWGEQIRLVSETKPKCFVIENVPGMTIGIAKRLLQNSMLELSKLGYRVETKLLNAMYFNCATSRTRLFCIGLRKDITTKKQLHPNPQTKPITVQEAIKNAQIPKHEMEWSLSCGSGRAAKRYIGVGKLKAYKYKVYGFTTSAVARNKPLVSPLGKAELYLDKRMLTPTELKLCFSFYPSWKLDHRPGKAFEGIAEGMPPNLISAIGKHLFSILYK